MALAHFSPHSLLGVALGSAGATIEALAFRAHVEQALHQAQNNYTDVLIRFMLTF